MGKKIIITEQEKKQIQEMYYDFDSPRGVGAIGNTFKDKLNTKTDFAGKKIEKGLTRNDIKVLNGKLEKINDTIKELKTKSKILSNKSYSKETQLRIIDIEIEIVKLEKSRDNIKKELHGEGSNEDYEGRLQQLLKDKNNVDNIKDNITPEKKEPKPDVVKSEEEKMRTNYGLMKFQLHGFRKNVEKLKGEIEKIESGREMTEFLQNNPSQDEIEKKKRNNEKSLEAYRSLIKNYMDKIVGYVEEMKRIRSIISNVED